MNWSYIAGYFDGEASLLLGIAQEKRLNKRGKTNMDGWIISPNLCVTSFDRDVLLEIKAFLERKGFKVYKLETKTQRVGQTDNATRLSIFGWDNVRKVLARLTKHSIGKRIQYELFRELHSIWRNRTLNPNNSYNKRMWTRTTFLRAMRVVDAINSHKSRQRGKYNTRFFKNLWEVK